MTPTPETDLNIRRIEFRDLYGEPCAIVESLLATEPAVWVGVAPTRMFLLDRDRALWLADLLIAFAATSRLPESYEDAEAMRSDRP